MAVQRPSNSASYWKEISQDPSSSVRPVHHKLHLSFPPYYLGDLKNSVKSVVDARLTRYEQELGGILAGYGRIAILKSQAQTLFNLSDVHVDVEGDFYVFSPEVGNQITGVVNRKSHGHLGCLVHNLFNVSLPKPYTVNAEDWLGRTAKLADEVKFTITKVDLQSQVPYIEGNIVEVISTSKPEESCLSTERSSSDSGVSVASEDQLAVEDNTEADNTMDKKRSKLSLTQRKKDALSSVPKPSPTSPPKPKSVKVRQISYSEDSNSSNAEMGESIRLELSEDTANASEKSSDSDEEIKSPKREAARNSSKVNQSSLRTSFLDTSSDSGADTKAQTPVSKVKKNPTESGKSSITTPVAQKAKQLTPKSGKKAAKAENAAVPASSDASPSKSKKRKRGEDSMVQESPQSKKAKVNSAPDENDGTESVDDLVSNLFAAMSKKNAPESLTEADSTPKNKKAKKVTSAQQKQDSADLANHLVKGLQPAKATPKSAKKAKAADTSVSTPKKAPGSPKKMKAVIDLDATLQQIVDRHLSEKSQTSEPMEVDADTSATNVSTFATSSAKKGKKKTVQSTEQEQPKTPVVTPKAKEPSSKKVKQVTVNVSKADIDLDEGVDVSETPVTKSKKIKSEKTSTPKVTKAVVVPVIAATLAPSTPFASLEGITPIKSTPAAKQGSKKKDASAAADQTRTTPKATPKAKEVKAIKEENDDDPESIIQELLQSSFRGSPAVGTKKTSSTPAQSKDDATRKIQTSIKKKPESDNTSNKRHSLQPGKGKKLKMEDVKDSHEKTIMKILQSVQPKEKSKIKSSKK